MRLVSAENGYWCSCLLRLYTSIQFPSSPKLNLLRVAGYLERQQKIRPKDAWGLFEVAYGPFVLACQLLIKFGQWTHSMSCHSRLAVTNLFWKGRNLGRNSFEKRKASYGNPLRHLCFGVNKITSWGTIRLICTLQLDDPFKYLLPFAEGVIGMLFPYMQLMKLPIEVKTMITGFFKMIYHQTTISCWLGKYWLVCISALSAVRQCYWY